MSLLSSPPSHSLLASLVLAALLIGGLAGAAPITGDEELLERRRAAYRELYPRAAAGDWAAVEAREDLLKPYVLWPDLRAAYLRPRIGSVDPAQIEAFLQTYGDLRPARTVRYRYALRLMRSGQRAAFLEFYERHYRDSGDATLDCLALQAEAPAEVDAEYAARGRKLWLVGRSQVDACNPVFARLREAGILDEAAYRARYDLAIDAGSFSLARYLAKSLSPADRVQAEAWGRAHNHPEEFVLGQSAYPDTPVTRRQLLHSLKRLTYRDPERALGLWQRSQARFQFNAAEAGGMDRYIALWTARWQKPGARELLVALPPDATDAEARNWLARVYLRESAWAELLQTIAQMEPEQRGEGQWQYWSAQSMAQLGRGAESRRALRQLAAGRSYYGFLAADALGVDYDYGHRPLPRDAAIQEALRGRTELRRAEELYRVGQIGPGRAEWDAAVANLDEAEQVQAALLAHRWGWHSRAIATAALARQFDDLQLRFPLPHRAVYAQFARSARISESWAYGISRSESLFMPDIRSGAGALGLMQLMPGTGKATAKSVGQPYRGQVSLLEPDVNIRLGTAYLGQLYSRFSDRQVLATAAYNAGPHRVVAWLPREGEVDARVWIENIPFEETRKYVRRVLEADTVFRWRLTGKTQRVSVFLAEIGPSKT